MKLQRREICHCLVRFAPIPGVFQRVEVEVEVRVGDVIFKRAVAGRLNLDWQPTADLSYSISALFAHRRHAEVKLEGPEARSR